jgi:hypothetical protein
MAQMDKSLYLKVGLSHIIILLLVQLTNIDELYVYISIRIANIFLCTARYQVWYLPPSLFWKNDESKYQE